MILTSFVFTVSDLLHPLSICLRDPTKNLVTISSMITGFFNFISRGRPALFLPVFGFLAVLAAFLGVSDEAVESSKLSSSFFSLIKVDSQNDSTASHEDSTDSERDSSTGPAGDSSSDPPKECSCSFDSPLLYQMLLLTNLLYSFTFSISSSTYLSSTGMSSTIPLK